MQTGTGRYINHKIRMEIMLEAATPSMNVGRVMFDLFNKAQSNGPVIFFDTDDVEITKDEFPKGKAFSERFMMQQVPTGAQKKVVMGFSMTSKFGLAAIKGAIGYSWLQQNRVYLRVQNMSFDAGVDVFLIGYLIKEHPHCMDLEESSDIVLEHWNEIFDIIGPDRDGNEPTDTEYTDLKEFHDYLQSNKLLKDGKVTIPISLERNFVKVLGHGSLKPFETFAVHVYVPREFKEIATKLNDLALASATTTTILPFALYKLEPQIFHDQMTQHASYLHKHRNIAITDVDDEAYEYTYNEEPITTTIKNTETEKPETITLHESRTITLHKLLRSNLDIYRVYLRKDDQLYLSVDSSNFTSVNRWLEQILPKFPYFPQLRKPLRSTSTTSSGSAPRASTNTEFTSKYSYLNRFNTASDNNFDASTISSKNTKPNAWTMHRPPAELILDHDKEFPELLPRSHTPTAIQIPSENNPSHGHPKPTSVNQSGSYARALSQTPQRGTQAGRGGGYGPSTSDSGYSTPTTANLSRDDRSYDDASFSRSIAASEATFNAKLAKLEKDQADLKTALNATMEGHFQKLEAALMRITATTSTTTNQVPHQSNHVFMTKSDAMLQHAETNEKMNAIQISNEETNAKMTSLQKSLDILLNRFSTMPSYNPDPAPNEIISPPRKLLRTDLMTNPSDTLIVQPAQHSAASPMDIEGASAN
jgi:hypothetical protein